MNRKMKSSLLSCFLLLVAAVEPGLAQQAGAPPVTLSGKVIGASGKHPVYVALWDSASFLNKPVQRVRINPQSDQAFHFQVAPGRWALSAYEDVNENGNLDMGLFGPKEPSGFWHPFHAWRQPRFSDVSVAVKSDETHADINIHK